jgi:hypothetical protein
MASTCAICNGELRKLLVTQKKPWRVLFQDELSIYRKEEALKKSYLDCDGCGEMCRVSGPALPAVDTLKDIIVKCTDCGGGYKNMVAGERPEFNILNHFAFLYRTCGKHVMQADGTFAV